MINEIKAKVYDKLKNDSTFVAMLASNKPFNNPAGASAKVNSIIPAFNVKGTMNKPLVTIQGGPETRISDFFFTNIVYVRVYNDIKKSFINIDNIVDRAIDLLHLQQLGLTAGAQVKMIRDGVSSETIDETLRLNYKEITFRVFML